MVYMVIGATLFMIGAGIAVADKGQKAIMCCMAVMLGLVLILIGIEADDNKGLIRKTYPEYSIVKKINSKNKAHCYLIIKSSVAKEVYIEKVVKEMK